MKSISFRTFSPLMPALCILILSNGQAKAQRLFDENKNAFVLFDQEDGEKAISVNRVVVISKTDGSSLRGRAVKANSEYLFFDDDSVLISDIAQIGIYPMGTRVMGSLIASTALTADILGVLLIASISSNGGSNDVLAFLGGVLLIGLSSVPWLMGSSAFFFQRKFALSDTEGWRIRS